MIQDKKYSIILFSSYFGVLLLFQLYHLYLYGQKISGLQFVILVYKFNQSIIYH